MIRPIGLLLCTAFCLSAGATTLDFEGFTDGAVLSTQYPNVTFSNATILSSGISLNEFEFPPHSGTNVVFDDGGPMFISFATPILSFSGYFTYAESLILQAFDASSNQVATAASVFFNNMALSGDPGSVPNEFIQLSFAGGISGLRITGDAAGGSFVLDDATYSTGAQTPVPEPGTWSLVVTAFLICSIYGPRAQHAVLKYQRTGFRKAVLILLGTGLFCSIVSAQSVGLPTVSPAAVNAGVPTAITVRSRITAANVIAGSVNVLRVSPTGVQTVIGQLHDDGIAPDPIAGDSVYSGSVTLNEAAVGAINLRVSIATRGSLLRTVSNAQAIDVLPPGVPTHSVAADFSQLTTDPASGQLIVGNEVLACFIPTADVTTIAAIGGLFNGTIIGRFSGLGNCYQFGLPAGSTGQTVNSALNILRNRPEVVSAAPDNARIVTAVPCAFPTCNTGPYNLLKLDDAHAISTGAGITIAVLDTGVNYNDPFLNPPVSAPLAPRILLGPNTTTNAAPANADPIDFHGHGTHVAGIVAATAPDSHIYAVKVMAPCVTPTCGNAPVTDVQASEAGIRAATDFGVQVINMSYAGEGASDIEQRAIVYALSHGVVLVAANGDGLQTPTGWNGIGQSAIQLFPAAYPGVLSVGATLGAQDVGDVRAGFSNFGSWTQIAAPGNNILSFGVPGIACAIPVSCTAVFSGTSQAAPFVSGTAGLISAVHPSWNRDQVLYSLEQTATPLAFGGAGPNDGLGYGRLNPVQKLGVSLAGNGSGSVTSTARDNNGQPLTTGINPGNLNCPGTCSSKFLGFATVALTAVPAQGSSFTGWSGDCSGTATSLTVLMTADKTCVATFTPTGPIIVPLTISQSSSQSPGTPGSGSSSGCPNSTINISVSFSLTVPSPYGSIAEALNAGFRFLQTGTGTGTAVNYRGNPCVGDVSHVGPETYEVLLSKNELNLRGIPDNIGIGAINPTGVWSISSSAVSYSGTYFQIGGAAVGTISFSVSGAIGPPAN